MKKLQAHRYQIPEPVKWQLRSNRSGVFYKIETIGKVGTPDGEMLQVKIQLKEDLSNPDADVAILLGQALNFRKSGAVDPQSPELWFWNDKFWIKARSPQGISYYINKCYVIYAVQVLNSDQLMEQVNVDYGNCLKQG